MEPLDLVDDPHPGARSAAARPSSGRPSSGRPRTPAEAWLGLLRRLGRGLGERRLSVAGVTLRLRELDFRSGGSAWSFGRLRDVRAVATEVDLSGLELGGIDAELCDGVVADRVVAECDALSLGARASASAITLTVTLPPATVQTLLDRSGDRSGRPVRLVFADGELRVPWLPGTEVVVVPEVGDDGAVTLRSAAVRTFGQRLDLPAWLPTTLAATPALPAGLRLLGVWREDGPGDGVVVRAVLDDPPPIDLERRHVRELVATSRRRLGELGRSG